MEAGSSHNTRLCSRGFFSVGLRINSRVSNIYWVPAIDSSHHLAQLPIARILAPVILESVGVFMLLLGFISVFLFLSLGVGLPGDILLMILGSIACFTGSAILMFTLIGLGNMLSNHARGSSQVLRSAFSTISHDPGDFLEDLVSLETLRPSFISSLRLSIASMALILLLLISLLISIAPVARLVLIVLGGLIAPILMIASAHAMSEELRSWIYGHSSIEIQLLRRMPGDLKLYAKTQSIQRALVSTEFLASLLTLGLYTIYTALASILELSKHIEWHRTYEERLREALEKRG